MAVNTSMSPVEGKGFGYGSAQHLLNRAGFGGTPEQIAALQTMGLGKAVDLMVDYESVSVEGLAKAEADADLIRPLTPEEREALRKAQAAKDEETQEKYRAERNQRENEDRVQMRKLERWWLSRMIETPRPLEENLTLLWHGHFASNHRTVRDSYLMYKQNQMFRENALNFAALAGNIVHDPAMIRFLDNNTNIKRKPNENLARELMELFTLGVGNYSEQDIKEGARALTGYDFDDNDYVFRPRQHDTGSKTILGKTGTFDGDGFVKVLLGRPDCSMFVAYKLYKHFVADVLDPRALGPGVKVYITQLARLISDNDYKLKPALKAIFKSQHFYDPAITGGMVKSPVQLIVGGVRVMNTPVRDMGVLTDSMALMGQKLFDPPSVAGWDGGQSWINTATVFVRQNLCVYLIEGGKAPGVGRRGNDNGPAYDPSGLIADVKEPTAEAVVDHLMATLLGGRILKERRDQLVEYAGKHGPVDSVKTLTALLLLITAMPEFQLY